MKPIALINTAQEQAKFKHLALVTIDARTSIDIYKDNELIVFYLCIKGDKTTIEEQLELPLLSLIWVKSSIVDGFWQKPSDGGFAKNKHASKTEIESEELLISRSMHAGEHDKAGFNFLNKTRKSHISSFRHQELQLSDDILESTILPLFDDVILKRV